MSIPMALLCTSIMAFIGYCCGFFEGRKSRDETRLSCNKWTTNRQEYRTSLEEGKKIVVTIETKEA